MVENAKLSNDKEQALPTSCEDFLQYIDSLGIEYELFDHDPIFTVAEGEYLKKNIPGVHCRNLYIRDKKKKNYLLVMANETEIDLKKLPDILGSGRLSFGSADRLFQHLGIRPGSVNPFTIMNDPDNDVQMFLDGAMMDADIVNYHPMDNAKTIGLSPKDLIKFIEDLGHNYSIIDLSGAAP